MSDIRAIADTVRKEITSKNIVKYAYGINDNETTEFNIEGREFTLLRTIYSHALYVTVFDGLRRGDSNGNDFSDESIAKQVEDAVEGAKASPEDECKDIAPNQGTHVHTQGPVEPDLDKLFERVREFNNDIKEKYPEIKIVLSFARHVKQHYLHQNSNGSDIECFSGHYALVAEFCAERDNKATGLETFSISTASLDKPFIEYDVAKSHFESAIASLDEVEFADKFVGDVIFTPDCLAELVGFVGDCFVDGMVVMEGTGIWNDKVGKKVVDERITITADPINERLSCQSFVNNENFISEKEEIIKNGVLVKHIHSIYTANKTGGPVSKSNSWQIFMTPGQTSYKDMIKGIKKGLLVGSISCGIPGNNGELSGVAKNAFLIENGEIKGAVSETMVSLNLEQMFNNVKEISKETLFDGDCEFPYLWADNITISAS